MLRLVPLVLMAVLVLPVIGQTVLFEDQFNDCTLSSEWTVSLQGNQNFVWYVGTPRNPKSDSTSIDGTCMLVMDDDATGNNTPAIIADFSTPFFDARGFATILLEVDVHYRDLGNTNDAFEIWLSDGTTNHLLRRYDNRNPTGSQFSKYVSFSSDLSFFAQTDSMQITFRYDDGAGFAWWAGIDNVRITGIGEGSPVIIQRFDSCALPFGWSAEVISGEYDWFFDPPPSTRYDSNSSMNGTCFVLFDDDYIGQQAKASLLRLASPWFSGGDYATFQLQFELIFRWYISESFSVHVENGDGERTLVASYTGAVGGPSFSNFVRQSLDLSPYRHAQMRVVFEFDDGGSWGWWAGLDNVKITGHGEARDICANAVALVRDQFCVPGENSTAMFEGPVPSCSDVSSSGIWYRWEADTTGWMLVSLSSDFNDVVSIFTGQCDNLGWVTCGNRDRYGFKGEKSYFLAQEGTTYFIRISGGMSDGFGAQRGTYCMRLEGGTPPQPELNDPCAGAIPLLTGQDCVTGNNLYATTENVRPSRNIRADGDVWYTFVAPAINDDQVLRFESNAGFSDVLTLYEGDCLQSSEVVSAEYGLYLDAGQLTAGQTYFLQVAGNFATIEGGFCIKANIRDKAVAPPNDDCLQATMLYLGADCTSGSLEGANFSGKHPPCVVSTTRDAWYAFVAPPGGSVQIIVEAGIKQNTTIWSGTCDTLTPIKCLRNPIRCDGFQHITGLAEGMTYYVQISATGEERGEFCVQLLDGVMAAPFDPLGLTVQPLCIGMDSSLLLIQAYHGVAPYTFAGTPLQQLLYTGEEYMVVVRDAMGCEVAISGFAPECEAATSCAMDLQFAGVEPTCADAADGSLVVTASNGDDPYVYVWSIPGEITPTVQNVGGGIYSVTVYDIHGCSTEGSFNLQAPPAIDLFFTEVIHPVTGGDDGSITAAVSGGTGVLSVAWYDRDGALLSDSLTVMGIGMGEYTCVVTDANGCTASESVILNLVSTGAPEEKSDLVQIVPNPAREKAFILISETLSGPCDLQISDPTGRIVQTFYDLEVQQGQIPLDIQGYPGGTYFVRIDIDEKEFTKRLLVVKR